MIDPYKRGSAGGQCRCVSKYASKFRDLKKAVSRSLVYETKGILEQPSNTSLLQNGFTYKTFRC